MRCAGFLRELAFDLQIGLAERLVNQRSRSASRYRFGEGVKIRSSSLLDESITAAPDELPALGCRVGIRALIG